MRKIKLIIAFLIIISIIALVIIIAPIELFKAVGIMLLIIVGILAIVWSINEIREYFLSKK